MPEDLPKSIAPKRIANEIDGYDPEASRESQVNISLESLKAALEAAYHSGVKESAVIQEAYNPELFFWQLMDNLPDHVYFKDLRSRFTCINRTQARFLRLQDPNDAIGNSDFDYFPEEFASEQFTDEQEIIRTGIGYSLHEEKHIRENNSQQFIISSKLPLRDRDGKICGTFGISRDITDRHLAELEVERQRNLLNLIIQILPCRLFVRDMENRFVLVNQTYKEALRIKNDEELIGHTLAEFSKEDRVKRILEEDQRVQKGESILNQIDCDLNVFNENSWIVTSKVPLRDGDSKIEGIVGMTYDITEQKKAEQEAQTLSEQLRTKNTQFEAELLVARQLQETLMSIGFDKERNFRKCGNEWNINASYFYKPSHHLAGDFFDLIQISKHKLGILVCDVMGHGVKAALVTMLLRGLIAELSPILDQPARVLGQINKRLCSLAEDQEFPRFTTAVYLTLDLQNGIARIANAGHPTPLQRVHNPEGIEEFEPCPGGETGPALGLIPEYEFQRHQFEITEKTELLFYTDGIIEQTDVKGEEFGISKLEEFLLKKQGSGIATELKTIEKSMIEATNTDVFGDDICLVAVEISPNAKD